MNTISYQWEFFLSHASADEQDARDLYDLLSPHAKVFLDVHSIELGTDWDQELAKAQKNSLITVVLISSKTDDAYYAREEIAAAIQLARSKSKEHRVVPVFLDGKPDSQGSIPFGLRLKHGLVVTRDKGMREIASRLLNLLRKLIERGEVPGRTTPPDVPPTDGGGKGLGGGNRMTWAAFGAAVIVGAVVLGWVLNPVSKGPVEGPGKPPIVVPKPISSADNCVSVSHFSPNVIPHYLLNSIGSQNFPYWLKIVAENNCGNDKFMKVRFESGHNIDLLDPPQTEEFEVLKGGEPVSIVLTPNFDLSAPQIGRISIQWSIEDENKKKYKAGKISTEIVPPYTIAWDLKRPKESGGTEPVDDDYLLASLQAWMLKPPRLIAGIGKSCRSKEAGGALLFKEEAIAACYQRLFQGDESIPVTPTPIEFPAGDRQVIRPHIEIIKNQLTISSLEAALLFASVMEVEHIDGVDYDLTLVVAPMEGVSDPDRKKSVFIAWREPGSPWRAIDMSHANNQDFAVNIAAASGRVGDIFDLNSEILQSIEKNGAGFSSNKRIAAIDFGQIPTEYQIRKFEIISVE